MTNFIFVPALPEPFGSLDLWLANRPEQWRVKEGSKLKAGDVLVTQIYKVSGKASSPYSFFKKNLKLQVITPITGIMKKGNDLYNYGISIDELNSELRNSMLDLTFGKRIFSNWKYSIIIETETAIDVLAIDFYQEYFSGISQYTSSLIKSTHRGNARLLNFEENFEDARKFMNNHVCKIVKSDRPSLG